MAKTDTTPPTSAPHPPPGIDPYYEARMCFDKSAYFIETYGVIDNVQEDGTLSHGDTPGTIPFRIWDGQQRVVSVLQVARRVVILKARQLGISWIVCGHALHHCLFRPGKFAMLFSRAQAQSEEMVRRIKALYDRLPGWLKDRLPRLEKQNTRELVWSNGSRIMARPATPNAAVSYTVSMLVMDEAAKTPRAGKLYAAAKPAADAGNAQVIVLSTAEGLGGFFHDLWDKAVSGYNGFAAVFLPWWARPDRGWDFVDRVKREAVNPDLIPQEYPANPLEAFIASGSQRFANEWVARQWEYRADPMPAWSYPARMAVRPAWPGAVPYEYPDIRELGNRGLRVFEPPAPGREYVIASDVAGGKDPDGRNDPDYDTFTVVDRKTGIQAAAYDSREEPDALALSLMLLSEVYNGATVIVERNNHGGTTLNTFKHKRFPTRRIGLGHDGEPGWLTSAFTKPLTEDLFAAALRDNAVTIRDRTTLQQVQVYSRLKNGTTGAPCFPPGTQILDKYACPVSIDSVQLYESIITHTGKAHIVTDTMKRQYDGELVVIKASGIPDLIEATPEHPFWARRRSCKHLQRIAVRKEFPAEWVDAKDLKSGDWLAVPKRTGLAPTTYSPEQLYAFGFWIAEGHLRMNWKGEYPRGISITNTDPAMLSRATEQLEKMFPEDIKCQANQTAGRTWAYCRSQSHTAVRHRPGVKPAIDWSFHSRSAGAFFAETFGRYSHGKFIGPGVFNHSGLLPLVTGYIDGDASQRKGDSSDVNIYTTSERLAWQMRQILIDSGVWCTLQKFTRKPHINTGTKKLIAAPRPTLVINIKASYLHLLRGCKVKTADVPLNRHVIEDEGYFYTAIRKVGRREYSGPVYNMAVEGDNSYTAGGVAVHNCGYHDDHVSAWMVLMGYLDRGASSNTVTQGYSPIGGYRG